MAARNKLAITGGRVIDPAQGIDRIADVLISNGKIEQVTGMSNGRTPDGYERIDAYLPHDHANWYFRRR